MKSIIGSTTYTDVQNLTFTAATDVTADTLPINQFVADINTDDALHIGQPAVLRDDMDGLWASYYLYDIRKIKEGTQRVTARSPLWILESKTLAAEMYIGKLATAAIEDVFEGLSITGRSFIIDHYSIDSRFDSVTLTGFCPEQSARDRLHWICLAIGACVNSAFSEDVEIVPIDDGDAVVPIDETFATPQIGTASTVTAVRVKYYSFAAGTPTATDSYVTADNVTYYIMTEGTFTLENEAAPSTLPENIVEVDGVYLIDSSNVGAVAARLATYWFNSTEVTLDIIDNATVTPGQQATVFLDADTLVRGHVLSANFRFGTEARASLKMVGVQAVESAELVVTYLWDGTRLSEDRYRLPVGTSYEIDTRYVDQVLNGHRYIFRPDTDKISGTMTSAGATVTVNCEIALDLFGGVLHVISVDQADEITETEDGKTIHVGVIA